MTKTPSYLMLRNGIYYFQTRIPADSVHSDTYKSKLVRRSTRTGNRAEALKLARTWWVELKGITMTTADEIHRENELLARKYHNGKRIHQRLLSIDPNDVYEMEMALDECSPDDSSDMNYYQDEKFGDGHVDTQNFHAIQSLPIAPTEQKGKDTLLSELLENYIQDYTTDKIWKDRSAVDFKAHISMMIEMIGDVPPHSLTKTILRDRFIKRIQSLPTHVNKLAAYRKDGKRVELNEAFEICRRQKLRVISNRTVEMYIDSVEGFLSWLRNLDYLSDNYSELFIDIKKRLKAKIKVEKGKYSRDEYSAEELTMIFLSEPFRSGTLMKRPERYWTPIIALFTGARLEEICQLTLSDIKQYDNMWTIDFNDEGDKSLKNIQSKREVPIHSQLIALGFLSYLDYIRDQYGSQNHHLFPNLTPNKFGQRSRKITRWFNGSDNSKQGFKDQCGIQYSKKSRKDFHSFRHTFINYGKQNGFCEKVMREIAGHTVIEEQDTHSENYGKAFYLNIRQEVIEQIDYGIDFSLIKQWPKSKKKSKKSTA